MKAGDVVGSFHSKDVVVTTGVVEWSEVYGTVAGKAKQSIKLKGLTDLISTCLSINRGIKKGQTVSAYTVSGNNERIILGCIVVGGPEGLKEFEPPKAPDTPVIDRRKFRGTITSCNIRSRYGTKRQWIRAWTGQMFITRKYINQDIEPGDEVEFEWFWNKNCKSFGDIEYCTLCSDITIIRKHENN